MLFKLYEHNIKQRVRKIWYTQITRCGIPIYVIYAYCNKVQWSYYKSQCPTRNITWSRGVICCLTFADMQPQGSEGWDQYGYTLVNYSLTTAYFIWTRTFTVIGNITGIRGIASPLCDTNRRCHASEGTILGWGEIWIMDGIRCRRVYIQTGYTSCGPSGHKVTFVSEMQCDKTITGHSCKYVHIFLSILICLNSHVILKNLKFSE